MKLDLSSGELAALLQRALHDHVSAVELHTHPLTQAVELRLAGLRAAASYLDWMDTDTIGLRMKPSVTAGSPLLHLRLTDLDFHPRSAASPAAGHGDSLSRLAKRLLRRGANVAGDSNWVRSRILANLPSRDWLAFDAAGNLLTLDVAKAFHMHRWTLALRDLRVEIGGIQLDGDLTPPPAEAPAEPAQA